MDKISKAKRRQIMRKIHSKGTKIELAFKQEHPEAIEHPDFLPFHPDFLWFGKPVFLDSPFWHGFISVKAFENINPYWKNKIFRNIVRDWCAIAFYGTEALRLGKITWKDILIGRGGK